MTAHIQHPIAEHDHRDQTSANARVRPWWILPGIALAAVGAVLVIAGVLPLSTAIYAALFGGMILMHVGGHGGHGGHGGGDPSRDAHLSGPSADAHTAASSSAGGIEDRQTGDLGTREMNDDVQRNTHSCH